MYVYICMVCLFVFCFLVGTEPTDISASINLLGHYGLEHSYNKYFGKKVKEELSSFLPHLPGNIDSAGIQDNRRVIINLLGFVIFAEKRDIKYMCL